MTSFEASSVGDEAIFGYTTVVRERSYNEEDATPLEIHVTTSFR